MLGSSTALDTPCQQWESLIRCGLTVVVWGFRFTFYVVHDTVTILSLTSPIRWHEAEHIRLTPLTRCQ